MAGATTGLNKFGITEWVVNPIAGLGTHQTIQAAETDASDGDVILVMPGTYAETFTLTKSIRYIGEDSQGLGTLGQPAELTGILTISSAISVSFNGFEFAPSGASAINYTVAATCFINNCRLIAGTGVTGLITSAVGGTIYVNESIGNASAGGIFFTGPATFVFYSCNLALGAGGGGVSTTSGGLIMANTALNFGIEYTGASGLLILTDLIFNGSGTNAAIALSGGSSSGSIDGCFINSGTQSGIVFSGGTTTCSVTNTAFLSSNASVVTGSGTLNYDKLSFTGSSSVIDVSTTNKLYAPEDALVPSYTAIDNTDSPYTVLYTDSYISVDSSGGAVTIRLPNAPFTKKVFTVKDRTGSAATNNITVTTLGGAVSIDAGTSFVMNNNYSSTRLVFNGTSYEIF